MPCPWEKEAYDARGVGGLVLNARGVAGYNCQDKAKHMRQQGAAAHAAKKLRWH